MIYFDVVKTEQLKTEISTRGRPKADVLLSAETECATESKPKPKVDSVIIMPACQGPQYQMQT